MTPTLPVDLGSIVLAPPLDHDGVPRISEPGQYDLTEAQYHADPVVGGSLSSSGARALLPPSSPARYQWDRQHGRPDTDAFALGRAAHSEVLGVGAPIVAIDAKDWRGKTAQIAAAEARAAGATPLLRADVDRVTDMATALRAHPIAGPLFARPGTAEQSFVARDPESGVMCRARVDWMPDVDRDARLVIVDYKTTASAHPGTFAASMSKYGYHQQGPFYCDVLSWLGVDRGVEPVFVLVAQEKTPPYLVTVATPSVRAIEWGRVLNRKARDVYRECSHTGHWPGYTDQIEQIDIPGWLDHQYDAALAAGTYQTIGDLT
ncbi:MAG: PD-(D/E)XK nuclease-like domain-containing protein [Phycicoccus sp.]